MIPRQGVRNFLKTKIRNCPLGADRDKMTGCKRGIFEIHWGLKKPMTAADLELRTRKLFPSGRTSEEYRTDCKKYSEIFRSGLDKVRVCAFCCHHKAMRNNPQQVQEGYKIMYHACAMHRVHLHMGDANQSAYYLVKSQTEVDMPNSMHQKVARAPDHATTRQPTQHALTLRTRWPSQNAPRASARVSSQPKICPCQACALQTP